MPNPKCKLTTLSKRKEGMSLAEFRKYTLEVHVPLVKNIPGVVQYSQSFVQHGDDPAPFDLVTDIWFESKEAMEQGFASEEARAAFDDVPRFISDIHTFPVEEHELL